MNRIFIAPVIVTLFAASIAGADPKDGPRGPMGADANKDGVVTLDEAVAAAKARFAAADTNKDGKLSADEMKNVRPHGRHGGKGGGPGPAKMFERLDANKDGKLTRDELRAKSDEHFTKLDVNKDGVVTREEAAKAHPPHHH
jgi:Ca2+-binding EF-hand superfamily protein